MNNKKVELMVPLKWLKQVGLEESLGSSELLDLSD